MRPDSRGLLTGRNGRARGGDAFDLEEFGGRTDPPAGTVPLEHDSRIVPPVLSPKELQRAAVHRSYFLQMLSTLGCLVLILGLR